ncbi:streptamidine family RiPP [Nocardiopsis mangrovi]|uniref:Streptamidine family RiPP n=2 Tax=Nocardiopsis TaxID=2013 RepID=A0ABV9DZY9_9ACTN
MEQQQVFVRVEQERELPHNSASHSNALVENPFDEETE